MPAPVGQVKLRLPAADVDAFVISSLRTFMTDNAGWAKLLRAVRIRSDRLDEALQKAEATSRELEHMPFQSKFELVVGLIPRIDIMQACLRITFRITEIVRYLIGGENAVHPSQEQTVSADFPKSTIMQNGAGKLGRAQTSRNSDG